MDVQGGEASQRILILVHVANNLNALSRADGRTAFDKYLLLISQGEEKEKTSEEKRSTGERSDNAVPPDDGLSDEVRERKRLSLAAQQVSAANFRFISNCEI